MLRKNMASVRSAPAAEVTCLKALRSEAWTFAVAPGGRFAAFTFKEERPVLVTTLSESEEKRGEVYPLRQLVGPGKDPLYCSVAFTDDVRHLVVGEEDGFVNVWNLAYLTGDPVLHFKAFPDPVDCVAASEDFAVIAAGSCEGEVSLFQAKNGELLGRLVGHRGAVTSLTFWRNKYLASTSLDRSVRVWDLEGACEKALLVRHRTRVNSLQFSADGCYLVSASNDCEALVWNLETKQVQTVITAPGPLLVAGVTKDMKHLVGACPDGSVYVWDAGVSGGQPLATYKTDQPIVMARWDGNADVLVAVLTSGHVQKWAFTSGTASNPAPADRT